MSNLKVNHVSYDYGESGVADLSFTARQGAITAIVGASGSGKSTILKLIAGFLQPEKGTIAIGDKLIASSDFNLAPKDRSIGLVFQSHTLLPHMNVQKNIEFGCHNAQQMKAVTTIMRELRIEKLSKKYPHEISGGESQRVSLARAIAANAKIFLMDEPFSSIDSVFRRDLRGDLANFMRRQDRTTVIVTHDAEEALELADHIIVLDQGKIIQQGSPQEVYFQPVNYRVAQFFGEVNHITGEALIKALTGKPQKELLLRPELLRLDAPKGVEGRIIHVAFRGNHFLVSAMIENERCIKVRTTDNSFQFGQTVKIGMAAK